MFDPLPTTVALNVVVLESDTNVLCPAVVALGKSATLYTVVERMNEVVKEFSVPFNWLKYKRKILAN